MFKCKDLEKEKDTSQFKSQVKLGETSLTLSLSVEQS